MKNYDPNDDILIDPLKYFKYHCERDLSLMTKGFENLFRLDQVRPCPVSNPNVNIELHLIA